MNFTYEELFTDRMQFSALRAKIQNLMYGNQEDVKLIMKEFESLVRSCHMCLQASTLTYIYTSLNFILYSL